MELCQVHQLFESGDDLVIGREAAGSHRSGLLRLLSRLGGLGAPGLELVNQLGEPVGVVEGVGLEGILEPVAVLLRHRLEVAGCGTVMVLH